MRASVVIRTLDEERFLPALLDAVLHQETHLETEIVVVDSGSTDRTLEIARSYDCRIEHIDRGEFSFGRSLNRGCEAARGEILVFVSGHCVPADRSWLRELVRPLLDERAAYVYGRQLGGPETRWSEAQLFARRYPPLSRIPQEELFCNNANAALRRELWEKFRFDEAVTGLEDMQLAKVLLEAGHRIGYVAEAAVAHHHDESFGQVRWRFEREALALQHILPSVHLGFLDFLRYFASAVLLDAGVALDSRQLWARAGEIVRFRFAQYWGSYRGHREHRELSRRQRERYFYPEGR